MADYPDIQIDQDDCKVIVHNKDGSYKISNSVEALILAKILFEIEKIGLRLEGKMDD